MFLLLSSCAQQRIVLSEKMKPFEGLDQTSAIPHATLPIKIMTVSDSRANAFALGEARTGARFKKTPVVSENGPENFVRSYLEKGLREREVLIVEQDQKVELNVSIHELWVEEVLEKFEPEKAKCRVSLEIHGVKNKEDYTGKFWTEVMSPGDLGDATEKLQPTLASCMNAVVEKIVKDKKFASFVKAQPLL